MPEKCQEPGPEGHVISCCFRALKRPAPSGIANYNCSIRDVIHFEGTTAKELARAFRESIDSYLELCTENGQQPDRPFNGKILVRTEPELHRKAALRAAVEGVSLSRWISRQIESAP
jgi:predicted HicB family RNase H-like nuclease